MAKKYLRKNEFRLDLNSEHYNKNERPHPAYITARYGHKYKANSITHSRTIKGVKNYDIFENPNQNSRDKRITRISPPFWQNENLFGSERMKDFKFSKQTRRKIKKFNKKFYK